MGDQSQMIGKEERNRLLSYNSTLSTYYHVILKILRYPSHIYPLPVTSNLVSIARKKCHYRSMQPREQQQPLHSCTWGLLEAMVRAAMAGSKHIIRSS